MVNPNGYIQGSNGEPLELVDVTARRQLSGKLDTPGGVKAGDYLRVKSVSEDGTVVVEGVEGPAADSGQNVELDATLTKSGAAADAKAVGDKLAEITGISLVEPAEDDIPKVFITGVKPTTKDDVLAEMQYISKTERFHAYLEIKCQGSSSMSFAKKNFTVKLYSDEARETKKKKIFKDWNHESNKFVLKANWIDHSHARNIVSARIWDEIVKSRPNYAELPEEMRNSPQSGAIDGFPVKLYYNGTYEGLYTWNIGKDDWMWGMDEDNPNHTLLSCCYNDNGVLLNKAGNFRALWSGVHEDNWDIEVGAQGAALTASLNALISCVKDTDDETFKATIGQYLDINSALDYYLYFWANAGLDSLENNMLLATYDGKKWICGAYDMDSVWGLHYTGSRFIATDFKCPDQYQGPYSLLWERITALFIPELQARYAELRSGVLSYPNIVTHFERFMDVIGLDLYAEDLTIYTGIPSGGTNNIKQIRNYVRDRLAYVDAEVSAMEPPAEPIPCTGITLSASELTFTGAGKQTLTATVEPDGCTDKVVWTSNDNSVATVTNGVVTAKNNGNATITATCGGYSASCSVSVSGIESGETGGEGGERAELFDKSDLPINGQSFVEVDGVEYYRYHAGQTCGFTWINPKPQKGAVTITARGVSQYGGTGSTRLKTVYDDGTSGPDMPIVVNGESQTVTVTTDENKTLAKITGNYDMENWVLLDMSVMSVKTEYAVFEIHCTGITLSASELTFTGAGKQTLTATVEPDGCTDNVVWTSTDSSVVSVTNGVVTAKANGNATITATCGSYSASCSVSVSGIENFITADLTAGIAINTSGTIVSYSGTYTSDFIEVESGNMYSAAIPDGSTAFDVWAYNESQTAIREIARNNLQYPLETFEFGVPADVKYIRICVYNSKAVDTVQLIKAVPDESIAYNTQMVKNYKLDKNGALMLNHSTLALTTYYPVEEGATYTVTMGGGFPGVMLYDENLVSLGEVGTASGITNTFTVPTGAKYARWMCANRPEHTIIATVTKA